MDDTKDKIENKKDQVVGRAKEKFGDATDNEELELKGKIQSSTGDFKEEMGDMKDNASKKHNDYNDDKKDNE